MSAEITPGVLLAITADAVGLLEEAFFLRQNGEYAPGGKENWRDWERKAEVFLRAWVAERTAVQRHADHDPSLTCRPAGHGLCEVLP